MADSRTNGLSDRSAKKCAEIGRILVREEIRARTRQVNAILKKPSQSRSSDEEHTLEISQDIVNQIRKNAEKRQKAKERLEENEDTNDMLQMKCQELANVLRNAKHLVLYTGAGISTAASIPDYRGPNGVWTLLQKGIQVEAQDLGDAEPTYTHMAIKQLYEKRLVKYVVSQNCDGLHLRSGLPRDMLSELHGNMFLEICKACNPRREYLRVFDVTERTGIRRHKTERNCHQCNGPLADSIIHFGEKGPLSASPYNWEAAANAADKADVILCLGSSLKVLSKYPCLWQMHKTFSQRPKLYIVNLQWTSKDLKAALKINGKCDQVMKILMEQLSIDVPAYNKKYDPIFQLATPLRENEYDTTSRKQLQLDGLNLNTLHSGESEQQGSKQTCVKDHCDRNCDTHTSCFISDNSSFKIHAGALLSSLCKKGNQEIKTSKPQDSLTKVQPPVSDRKEIMHNFNKSTCSMYISLKRTNVDSLTSVQYTGMKPKPESSKGSIDDKERKNQDHETKSPQKSPVSGVPGWFGIGLAIKKRKKSTNN